LLLAAVYASVAALESSVMVPQSPRCFHRRFTGIARAASPLRPGTGGKVSPWGEPRS
jgi:hypothetical protein